MFLLYTQLLRMYKWGGTVRKCALFERFFVLPFWMQAFRHSFEWGYNSPKHFCFQTWSDDTLYMHIWLGTCHLCSLFVTISHLILPIRWATLTERSEVRGQQGVWSETLPQEEDRKTREEVTILPSTPCSSVWPQFFTSVDKSRPLSYRGNSKFRDNDLWGLLRPGIKIL